MYPIICEIGPLTIYTYGFMLAIAFIVVYALAVSQAKRQNIHPDIIFNLFFIALIFGIAGARIFYVLENPGYYFKDPLEIIMLQHGGLSWFGGLAAGIVAAFIYLKKKSLPVYKIFDLVVPYLALGQAIGRIGCLLNGCCFGRVSKFGLYFSVHKQILIPTQLYSCVFLILIYILLRYLQERPHKVSDIFFTYLLLYSAMRFFIEFWRADNQVIFFGLTLFQIISIVIFALSAIKLLLIKNKNARV